MTVAVVAALSGGHLLVEDVPGVGKRCSPGRSPIPSAEALARPGSPRPPADRRDGVSIYSQETMAWEFRPGPVFAHVVLVDELNRTPPRTQSALLEAMEEQQVTVDGDTSGAPRPHLVLPPRTRPGSWGRTRSSRASWTASPCPRLSATPTPRSRRCSPFSVVDVRPWPGCGLSAASSTGQARSR